MRFDLEQSIDVLGRTPAVFIDLLSDTDDRWSRATEGPETFSPFDVVGHMHDLGHIAQVTRVMAKQYREEIGPWVPYLPIVTDRPVPQS